MKAIFSIVLVLFAACVFALPFTIFGCRSNSQEKVFSNVSTSKQFGNSSTAKNKVQEIKKRSK